MKELFFNHQSSIINHQSNAIGIGFVDLSGYGIQQITIAGLVIALGMLVDNAIVVTENATRFLKMGFSPKDAAIKGADQIGWAVVNATVTTVLAFVPIIMMRDITGEFIRSMPLIVVYTLTASLFIALTFTPYLSSKFLKIENVTELRTSSNIVTRLLSKIRNFQDYFIQHPYRRILDLALSHSKLVIAISLILFFGSLALSPLVGVSFFPKAEKPQLIININTLEGTSLDKTDDIAKYVESVLSAREEIKHYATNVGHGNPRIYYNVGSSSRDSTHAQIFIELKKYDRKMLSNLLSELRGEFADYPDAHIEVKEFEQGPPIEAPIVVLI